MEKMKILKKQKEKLKFFFISYCVVCCLMFVFRKTTADELLVAWLQYWNRILFAPR